MAGWLVGWWVFSYTSWWVFSYTSCCWATLSFSAGKFHMLAWPALHGKHIRQRGQKAGLLVLFMLQSFTQLATRLCLRFGSFAGCPTTAQLEKCSKTVGALSAAVCCFPITPSHPRAGSCPDVCALLANEWTCFGKSLELLWQMSGPALTYVPCWQISGPALATPLRREACCCCRA